VDNPEKSGLLPVRHLNGEEAPHLSVPAPSGPFGLPATETQPALQTDAYKEIVNKLAWCLGSVYRVPYAGKRTAVRIYAERMARAVVRDHGYPRKIAKSK